MKKLLFAIDADRPAGYWGGCNAILPATRISSCGSSLNSPSKVVIKTRLRNLFGRGRRKLEPGIVRVRISDEGFEGFTGDGKGETVNWSEVERIFTYKVDCFTYDMIWLAFERRGHEGALHIREETEGFQDLMSALAKAFPDLNPEWYFDVMQPPFAERLTVLFDRTTEV